MKSDSLGDYTVKYQYEVYDSDFDEDRIEYGEKSYSGISLEDLCARAKAELEAAHIDSGKDRGPSYCYSLKITRVRTDKGEPVDKRMIGELLR